MRGVKTLGKVVFAIIITFAGILLMPRLFGYAPYAVLSGSMEPEYPVGSLIYVTATDPSNRASTPRFRSPMDKSVALRRRRLRVRIPPEARKPTRKEKEKHHD